MYTEKKKLKSLGCIRLNYDGVGKKVHLLLNAHSWCVCFAQFINKCCNLSSKCNHLL